LGRFKPSFGSEHTLNDVASLIPNAAAATVMELSVAVDANKTRTKDLLKAVGITDSEVTLEWLC
jgi:hypothetical protein